MKEYKKDRKMVVFLLIVTSLCTLCLTGVQRAYLKGIAEQQKGFRMKILDTFRIPYAASDFDRVFNEAVSIRETKKATFYIYRGEPRQTAMILSGSGLWSIIELFLVINEDNKVISRLEVLSHGETPGLGGRIEEDEFLNQFKDLDYSSRVKIVTRRKGEPGEVDAITGATKTSKSVENIINKGIEDYAGLGDQQKR
jgi:Na+-transporting NADH:ubiquinone oxidoreductase subunit C